MLLLGVLLFFACACDGKHLWKFRHSKVKISFVIKEKGIFHPKIWPLISTLPFSFALQIVHCFPAIIFTFAIFVNNKIQYIL